MPKTNTYHKMTSEDRKNRPIARGVLDYFPDALAEVALVSKTGNDQHNPGQEMHWAKEKSTDHADCVIRHLAERGGRDDDGMRHSAKAAWRALANLQIEIEKENERHETATNQRILQKQADDALICMLSWLITR